MIQKFLVCFILLLSITGTYANSPIKNNSYQGKIQFYIEKNKGADQKLKRIKSQLEVLLENIQTKQHEKTFELKIILQYFIGEINTYLLNKQLHGSHISTPENVKAIYYSAYSTSREDKIDALKLLAKNSEINAIVIDIKEVDGYTSFELNSDNFGDIKPESNFRISDISSLITLLHENNIYIIGRIVVFKDNFLTIKRPDLSIKKSYDTGSNWKDYKGNSYSDPYSKEVWDYHIDMASEVYKLGFDEINFDYVRFPSDGYISQTHYPFAGVIQSIGDKNWRMQVMEEFSEYITNNLKEKHPNIILSADIFGLATHTDLYQIGQNIETFIPYFDYVAPMIYPSHYGKGYLGYTVPDNAPYEIFFDSIKKAQDRIDILNTSLSGSLLEQVSYKKIRPWLQAFHCSWCDGASSYDRVKFRKQIEAMNDLGLDSWYVWNASGRYESDWYD